MQTYQVFCVGSRPVLMNAMSEEVLESLRTKKSIQRDRSQSRWAEAAPKIYRDGTGQIVIPGVNLLAAIVGAGRNVKNGRKQISTATSTTVFSFLTLAEANLTLLIYEGNGKFRPASDVILGENGLPLVAADDGVTPIVAGDWTPDMRKGRNPADGVAVPIVRAKFGVENLTGENGGVGAWGFMATLQVDGVSLSTVQELMAQAGRVCGLCDFRPNKKGNFGMFRPIKWTEVKSDAIEDPFSDAKMREMVFSIVNDTEAAA